MKVTTTKRAGSRTERRGRIAVGGLAAVVSVMTLNRISSGQGSSPSSSATAPADSTPRAADSASTKPQPSAAPALQGSAPASPSSPSAASSPTEPAPPTTYADARPRRPWFGGLGYASIAPFFGDLSGLEEGLRAPTALGASYGVGRTALLLGGGGGALLFGHLWLGGKGYGLVTGPFENLRGQAVLTGGGGGFELGYVLTPRPRMLFIPYLGLGGFAYNLEVTNKTSGPMPIQQSLVIPAGESRTFIAGIATLDIGIRVQRLLFYRNAGLTAGFELGLLRSLSTRPWQAGSVEFTDHPGAALDGAYVRVNFGGGGFFFR